MIVLDSIGKDISLTLSVFLCVLLTAYNNGLSHFGNLFSSRVPHAHTQPQLYSAYSVK